jgi:hypothetical protein
MKKFINDNIVFIVIGTVILAGLAFYKVNELAKANKEEKPKTPTTET